MSKIDSEQIEIIKKTFPKKYLHAKPRDDFTAQQWAATFGESSNCKKKKKSYILQMWKAIEVTPIDKIEEEKNEWKRWLMTLAIFRNH